MFQIKIFIFTFVLCSKTLLSYISKKGKKKEEEEEDDDTTLINSEKYNLLFCLN